MPLSFIINLASLFILTTAMNSSVLLTFCCKDKVGFKAKFLNLYFFPINLQFILHVVTNSLEAQIRMSEFHT